ncbi:MAG: Sec-independent protein translocase subunit TatA [Lapillicoccus sp.]
MLKDLAQPSHLIILAVLIIILFGWKKLPDAARSVGRSMRIFKSEMGEMQNDGKKSAPSPAASDTVHGTTAPTVPPTTTTPTAAAPTAAAPTTAPPMVPLVPQETPVDPATMPAPHDATR